MLSMLLGHFEANDELSTRLVDAALAQFSEYGIKRSTIDDVARRAGVSKMSVFRKFQNKTGLVAAVLAEELRRGMAELDEEWSQSADLEARVIGGFRFVVRFVRAHPLFERLLRTEPDMLLPLMTVEGGPVLALYRAMLAERLRGEVEAGRAVVSDIDQVAEVVARMALSLVLTRDGVISLDDEESLAAFVRLAVMPMLQATPG